MCIRDRLEEVYGGSAYGCRVLERAYVMELLVYLNRAYFETAEELVPDVCLLYTSRCV